MKTALELTLSCEVLVIGAGPAGLAAAIAAAEYFEAQDASPRGRVLVIEREERAGGILKQCVHDGFGVIRFGERLTGPEYARRFRLEAGRHGNIEVLTSTSITRLEKNGKGFGLVCTNPEKGVFHVAAATVVAAMGCRERTDRQVFIHGDRPSGIFTAGQAQAFINLKGYLPGKRCVILGSGDIGLIMARRLTLEGAEVEGVYEIKGAPAGLIRNIAQCLWDYDIPLHLGETVTELHGKARLEAVTVARVDGRLRPLPATERRIPCDALILSVGLIPENDLLVPLGPAMDPRTKGPKVDQDLETEIPGLFSCGNALHVNDLVDYVSESGEIAGRAAARRARSTEPSGDSDPGFPRARGPTVIPIQARGAVLYQVPARLNLVAFPTPSAPRPAREEAGGEEPIVLYFRASREIETARLRVRLCGETLFERVFRFLKPPEMERIELAMPGIRKAVEALSGAEPRVLDFDLEEAGGRDE